MTDIAELSSRAQRLNVGLASERTITIRLDRIWEVFAQTSPDIAREASKRQLLIDTLIELEGAGHIAVPRSRASWDHTGHPPLPTFVRRNIDRPLANATRDRLRHPWVPALAWAATERLTARQREALMAVSTWLARQREPPTPLPLRERSLTIFGHEKRLDELLGTPLFAPGRLTLEMLAAYVVHPPFVWTPITEASDDELLVIENHNTFDSICRAITDHVAHGASCPFRFVAYGAGNAFEASISYVADLCPRPSRVRYFGDLDSEGVTIPVRASTRALALGLPVVEPHIQLYRMLLDTGQPQAATSQGTSPEWLAELRQSVDSLFGSGRRLAQEWLTLERLRGDTSWLRSGRSGPGSNE